MPSIGKRNLHQKAVLYDKVRYDSNGSPVLSSGVEISVRWEIGNPALVISIATTISFDIALWVDREVAIGSIVWLGELVDIPTTITDLKEVVDYQEIPDVKGRVNERVLLLKKWNNTRPTVS